MVGYEQYNSLSKQWEYYNLSNIQSQEQQRQYGEYVQPYNLGLMERALSQKQEIYNYNYQKVQSAINDIGDNIKGSDINTNTKSNIIKRFQDAISKNLNNQSIDYGSVEQTNYIINWLWKTATEISENEIDMDVKKIKNEKSKISNDSYSERPSASWESKTKSVENLPVKNYYNDLGKYFDKKQYVDRIVYRNKNGKIIKDNKNLTYNSYVHLKENKIEFKNAKGEILYRNLNNEKYNKELSGYEFTSNFGVVFVHEELFYVKFYDSEDTLGNYYVYHISK